MSKREIYSIQYVYLEGYMTFRDKYGRQCMLISTINKLYHDVHGNDEGCVICSENDNPVCISEKNSYENSAQTSTRKAIGPLWFTPPGVVEFGQPETEGYCKVHFSKQPWELLQMAAREGGIPKCAIEEELFQKHPSWKSSLTNCQYKIINPELDKAGFPYCLSSDNGYLLLKPTSENPKTKSKISVSTSCQSDSDKDE